MRHAVALAALLVLCPSLSDMADARSPSVGSTSRGHSTASAGGKHASPKIQSEKAQHMRADKPSHDSARHGGGSGGYGSCVTGAPGACNWVDNHGRVENLGDCGKSPWTCSGTDPRLTLKTLRGESMHRVQVCQVLPMLAQASCLGLEPLTQENGQAAWLALGLAGEFRLPVTRR